MQNWNLNTIRQGLRTLVYPENCLICSALNQTVCDLCLQSWRKIPVRFQIENFNIYAVVPYDTFSSGVVLKAKEDRNKVAQNLMAEALASAIMHWRNANRNVQLLLVPIPSQFAGEGNRSCIPFWKGRVQFAKIRELRRLNGRAF
ncbi:MAG: hypothetical protein RL733_679 [Actinomycetota bacterium]